VRKALPLPSGESRPVGTRDAHGRFTKGNRAALVHGGRSKQVSRLHAPLRDEIVQKVIVDLGGDASLLPVTLLGLVDRYAEVSLLAGSYMFWLREQGGPIGTRGRQRAAVGGYLAALDRQMKLAVLIGLERKARKVGTVAELLA